MSQHSKLPIFRLGLKKNDWNFKYCKTSTENNFLYLHQSLQIEEFLKEIFKHSSILLYNFKIQRSYNKCNLIVTYLYRFSSNFKSPKNNKITIKNELLSFFNSTILKTPLKKTVITIKKYFI
jgi:hypothetical protein